MRRNPIRTDVSAPSPARITLVDRLCASDDRTAAYAAALAAAIVVVIAVPLASILNIWIDEGFTLHSTGAGLNFAWREAIEFEAQPPLYFLIEAAWRLAHEASIGFARFPSTIFAAAGAAAIVGAAHRLTPRIPPLVVALVSALNPLVLWAATEMRVYALVFLIGSVLAWSFFEAFLTPHPSRRAQIIYGCFALIGLYTQYYIGFMLAAQAVSLVIVRRAMLREFITTMAVVALGFLPFTGFALDQFRSSAGFVTHASLVSVAHEVLNDIFVYVLPHESGWSGVGRLAGYLLSVAVVAATVAGRPRLSGAPQRGLAIALATGVAMFCVLFTSVGVPPLVERHIIVIAPTAMLVALLVIDGLTRYQTAAHRIALGVYAVFTLATLGLDYRPPLIKPGDWQHVARVLDAEPPAPVAVFPAELAVPLAVYRSSPIVAIPRPLDFRADYVYTMALRGEGEVAAVLDPIRRQSETLWVVTTGTCGSANAQAPDDHCRYLSQYLNHRYRIVKTIAFRGALARLFARDSQAQAIAPPRHDAN